MIRYIIIVYLQISFISVQAEIKENNTSPFINTNQTVENANQQLKNQNATWKDTNQNQETQYTPLLQNNNSSSFVKKNNKLENKNTETKIESVTQNLSIELKSAISVIKNNLIEKNYSWINSIPYIDMSINYKLSKNLLFQTSFDLSYAENKWAYEVKEIFIKYQWFKFLPADFLLGHFEYPVLNFKKSSHKFSKKTLLEKNLFPEKSADMGALLKINFWGSFYLQLSSQLFTGKRELLFPLNTTKNTWTARLAYGKKNQHITANYLKQNLFSKKQQQALGLSSDFSYLFYSLLLNLKGEFWKISQWPQDTLSYYIFPSVKWKRLTLSFLHGKAYYQSNSQTSESREYILKTDLHLTDELFVSLERIKESDSITKNSSWVFSLQSHFNF